MDAELAGPAARGNGPGAPVARVRVVSLPLTDYSRFGVWCAQFTTARVRTSATWTAARPER
jgi:Family of unknown function (DUF6879)